MVRLKAEPPMPVRSMEELLAIGHAIKVEAAGRYAELSERMQAAGNGSVAAVFQRLSRDAHEDMLSIELQAQTSLGAAPNPRAMRWALPSILDEEAAGELASSRIVTPYRALSVAVRDAEQAFMLWSYLAAQTESTEVRHAAEARAQLELDRVASLRRDRRKAYHLEHPSIGARASSDTRNDADISLAALEERMADMLQQLAQAGAHAPSGLLQLAEEARSMAETPLPARAIPSSIFGAITKSMDDPRALAELLVERYLDAAEHPQDEAAMARAQSLAARAINRLARLEHDPEKWIPVFGKDHAPPKR